MKQKQAADYRSNAPLLKSVARLPKIKHGGKHAKSVRSFVHKSHEVSIATSYEVKIDGRTVPLPLLVTEDGRVQCHSIPNYSTSSAVDIVKAIIDLFPEEFEKKPGRRGAGGRHGRRSQGHHH